MFEGGRVLWKELQYPRNSLIKPERRRVLSIHIGGESLRPVVKRTGLGSVPH